MRAAARAAAMGAVLAAPSGAATVIEVPGGRVELIVEDAAGVTAPAAPAGLERWARDAARALTAYYGRFPVADARVRVRVGGRRAIGFGMMRPGDPPTITIHVGPSATPADFERDWTLTHEMVHLAFPDVEGRHRWIEEGVATYVEPLARVRAGLLSEEDAFRDLTRGMPRGLAGGGLDDDRSWGRTYWGGALFFLLADVEIRERTRGGKGLDDALRHLVAQGGNAESSWPLARVLKTADEGTGLDVLQSLHRRMAHAPTAVDLDALWRRLGVVAGPTAAVRLDDTAPAAALRRALVRGR